MQKLDDIPEGSILGLNFTGLHDSAVAIVDPGGEIRFACSLERLTRRKKDGRWPEALLRSMPWGRIKGVALSALDYADAEALRERKAVEGWPLQVAEGTAVMGRFPQEWNELVGTLPVPVWRFDHHECHAASAYYLSGYDDALVLTCDAGAFQCPWYAAAYRGQGDRLELLGGMAAGCYRSPANIYTLVTALLGLQPNQHEGKVTGLAARARVSEEKVEDFEQRVWPMVLEIGELLRWEMRLTGDEPAELVVNLALAKKLRERLSDFADAELAACVQACTERHALGILERSLRLLPEAASRRLCLAGGLFANVRINQILIERFEAGFVAPPMTDDGTALGAALLAFQREYPRIGAMQGRPTMYLGPEIDDDEVDTLLDEAGIRASPAQRPQALAAALADLLASGKTVAIARGRMEFGPRALGHRSILYLASDRTVNDWLNKALDRTEYMPFAPMTLASEASACYRDSRTVSRFMTVTVRCTEEMMQKCPATVHVDGTARPQILEEADDPLLHDVLQRLKASTGAGTVLNTSFNMHEEPIVCTAADALAGFARAGLDALCLGSRLILRKGNETALAVFAAGRGRPRRSNCRELALSLWIEELRERLAHLTRLKRSWFDPELERLRTEIGRLESTVEELQRDYRTTSTRLESTAEQLASKDRQLREATTELAAIKNSLTWKANRLFDMLRRGRWPELREHLKRFVDHRMGNIVRRFYRRRKSVVEAALDQLGAQESARPAPLSKLRARVEGFLPETPPRITAVVPCYNYGRLVLEAVDSLLKQSYPNLEVVVVNDGSTDRDTLAALADLERRGVRVVHQENQGLVVARNAGAKAAQGEFLLFLDNDDMLEPEAVALMLAHLVEEPEAAYAYPAQHFFGDVERIWLPQEYNAYDLMWSNHPTVCSLIRRAAFEKAGGYNPDMVYGWEDWEHWIALAEHEQHGSLVPVPVFRHRRHGRTMTHDAQGMGSYLRHAILSNHPDLYSPERITALKRRWRPAVSVVIPFHNAHRFLAETLESLEKQSFADFEILVVNDASDDPAALAALDELRRRRDVRVLDRPSRGDLAAARNTGVLAARSDHVFFLDPDDLLAPTALEKLVWLLLFNRDAGFAYTGVVHFGAKSGVCIDPYDVARLKRENFLTSAALVRREVYLRSGGMDETERLLFEDYDFWLRLAALGIHGCLLPEPLFFYRRHEHGRSAWVRAKVSEQEMSETLRRRNPVLYGDAREHPPHYRPLQPGQSPLRELEGELQRRYRIDLGAPWESYRRPNLPNPFPEDRWRDPRTNVLYLIPHMTVGGAERIDLDILQGLRAGGMAVTLVVERGEGQEWRQRFEEVAQDLFILPHLSPDKDNWRVFLEYILMSRNIDVVFNRNTYVGYELAQEWYGRGLEVRFADLLHVHNFGEDWVRVSAPYDRNLHRRFVTNRDLLTYMRNQYGVEDDRMRVIYCGVDTNFWNREQVRRGSLRRELRIANGSPVIGFVGRLHEQKDPLQWIRVAEAVAERHPEAAFVLVGSGPMEKEVEKAARRSRCRDRLHLLGYRDDVANLLADMDLLLLTSKYEGLPQVVFEAMSVGVPVVSSDAGGTRECVTPDVGRIVPRDGSAEHYAEAVVDLLSDEQRLDEMRRRCERRIRERFDVGTMQRLYCDEIDRLAAECDRRARLRAYQEKLMERSPL